MTQRRTTPERGPANNSWLASGADSTELGRHGRKTGHSAARHLRYRAAIDLAYTLKFLLQRPSHPVSFLTSPTSKHELSRHFTQDRKWPEVRIEKAHFKKGRRVRASLLKQQRPRTFL
jgi:hypothetical protein